MAQFCSHNFVYTQGHFYCTKCGKITYGKYHKKNQTKKIGIGVFLVLIVGIIGFLLMDETTELKQTNEKSVQTPKVEIPLKPIPSTPEKPIQINPENNDDSLSTNIQPSYSQKELVEYALQIINEDRKKFDLQPVTLSENQAAQIHAEDVLKTRKISHWMTNGEKPYMTYTRLGGTGEVSQNISFSGFDDPEECKNPSIICEKINPFSEIKKSEHSMMYDDASSDWGHKDNILQPYHTHVSLGIAYDDYTFVLVQNFEDNYIDFTNISENNGVVSFSGTLNEGSLNNIGIYYDQIPTPSLYQQHKDDSYYQVGGDPIIGDIPEIDGEYNGYQIIRHVSGEEESVTINKPLTDNSFYEPSTSTFGIADKWIENGNYVDVSFDMSPFITKPGVYIVILWIENKSETFPATSYSIIENNSFVEKDFISPKVYYACTEGQLTRYEEIKTKYDELSTQYDKIPQTVTSDQEYRQAMNMYYQLQNLNNQIMNFRCFHGITQISSGHIDSGTEDRFLDGVKTNPLE